jgi:hypothetical protein
MNNYMAPHRSRDRPDRTQTVWTFGAVVNYETSTRRWSLGLESTIDFYKYVWRLHKYLIEKTAD